MLPFLASLSFFPAYVNSRMREKADSCGKQLSLSLFHIIFKHHTKLKYSVALTTPFEIICNLSLCVCLYCPFQWKYTKFLFLFYCFINGCRESMQYCWDWDVTAAISEWGERQRTQISINRAYICIYLTPLQETMWHKVNFMWGSASIEFSIFLLLDWLPIQS